jgi:prephenate dehydrogenase
MLADKRITIAGFGLMGGSLALALRPHTPHITAVDPHPDTRAQAVEQGFADRAFPDLAPALPETDLLILAAPSRAIIRLLGQLPDLWPQGGLVMDLGSVKGAIVAAMNDLPEQFQAIGGHPMCGREVSGLTAALPDLYQGKTFILSRTARTTPLMEKMALELTAAVGASPLFLPADLHDELTATISHAPYVVAATLMAVAARKAAGQPDLWPVSASGFRDASRLAGSDPTMMGDILVSNREAVLAVLREYAAELTAVMRLIETGDDGALGRWLHGRQAEYRAYKKEKSTDGAE